VLTVSLLELWLEPASREWSGRLHCRDRRLLRLLTIRACEAARVGAEARFPISSRTEQRPPNDLG
jgi:hypothetical protein